MSLRMCMLIAIGLMTSGSVPAAEVYRCRDAQGRSSYSDQPCGENSEALAVRQTAPQAIVLSRTPRMEIRLDRTRRRDPAMAPLDVLAGCAATLMPCFDPKGDPEACFQRVPACTGTSSDRPGTCCPRECKDAVLATRGAPGDRGLAIDDVLFGERSCVPGLDALRGR